MNMTYRGADPTAVMGRRIGAYLIDVVILLVIAVGILVPLFFSTSVTAPSGTVDCGTDSSDSFSSTEFDSGSRIETNFTFCFDNGDEVRYIPADKAGQFGATMSLVSVGTSVLMLVVLQGLTGGSPGKLLLGLRVVKDDGSNAGILRCLFRTILLIVDAAFCAIIGLLTSFNSKRHRRVGDMVASTMVISRADRDALILARSGHALPGQQGPAGQQWSVQNQPTPPAARSWDPSGSIQTPGDPAPGGRAAPTTPSPPTSGEGPTWDSARNAYIQYEPARGAWMQYDNASQQWKPIDT